jgi:hypothetical protein
LEGSVCEKEAVGDEKLIKECAHNSFTPRRWSGKANTGKRKNSGRTKMSESGKVGNPKEAIQKKMSQSFPIPLSFDNSEYIVEIFSI